MILRSWLGPLGRLISEELRGREESSLLEGDDWLPLARLVAGGESVRSLDPVPFQATVQSTPTEAE